MEIPQRSFASGELAPSLYPRVDTVRFATGAKRVRNNIVMRQGGTQNRPGFLFVAEAKESSKNVRLIPFEYDGETAFIIELGDQTLRIIQDGDHVYDLTLTITGITNANPGVVTYTGTDPTAGQEVYISGITGAIGTYLNNRSFVVGTVNAGAKTFQLKYLDGTNVNTTAMGSWSSGGTAKRVLELATVYQDTELSEIRFAQVQNILILTHQAHAPQEIEWSGGIIWAIQEIELGAAINPISNLLASDVSPPDSDWVVTAIDVLTGEENEASSIETGQEPTTVAPQTLTWSSQFTASPPQGAWFSNVYKLRNGVYGFIGTAGTTVGGFSFIDDGITPDTSISPPVKIIQASDLFPDSLWPKCVGAFQQRLLYGNTVGNPSQIVASKTGLFRNFYIYNPITADSSFRFKVTGRRVSEVRHLLDLGKLVVFTSDAEFMLGGDGNGVIAPGAVNPEQRSAYGSGTLPPLKIDNNAIFLQARQSIVRDLGFDYQVDGYRGNDLTISSAHLFQKYTIEDWAYQQIPHSIAWAVRSDGTLLGMTYVREQQIIAWHRHDTDGDFKNIVCVPEGNEDAVYVVVEREIGGVTKKYIERMTNRNEVLDVDLVFMDAAGTYDGRNTAATTMTVSGGSAWTSDEELTITASVATFTTADVDNEIHLYILDDDGEITDTVRFRLSSYTSTTVMKCFASKTVPAALRTAATTAWARAADSISGLWHLEGKTVSVLGDGYVVASPNNSDYAALVVTNGGITLDRPYAVVHVGLPYISDLETLDIDSPEGESVASSKKKVSKVTLHTENTRGVYVGPMPPTDDTVDAMENLRMAPPRGVESYDTPASAVTGTMEVTIPADWNSNGRVFIRQVDPLPKSVLAVTPDFTVGG